MYISVRPNRRGSLCLGLCLGLWGLTPVPRLIATSKPDFLDNLGRPPSTPPSPQIPWRTLSPVRSGISPTYFLVINFIVHAYAARERLVFSLRFSTKYRLDLYNIIFCAIAVIHWRIASNTVAIQFFFQGGTLEMKWQWRQW